MKTFHHAFLSIVALFLLQSMGGCSNHEQEPGHGSEADNEHRDEPGYSFDEKRGVLLSATAHESISVQTAAPDRKSFRERSEAMARVYAAGLASVQLDTNTAARLAPGTPIQVGANGNSTTGTLVRVERQFEAALGRVEALIELGAPERYPVGSFVPVAFQQAEAVAMAVPESSILQTGGGDFVFVAREGHFARTRIQPGARADGWIEIAAGLQPGDRIATNNVQNLRCIELQATRAGTACCPVPSK
jgi:hypothetical protein